VVTLLGDRHCNLALIAAPFLLLWPPPTTAHLLSARRTAPFILTGVSSQWLRFWVIGIASWMSDRAAYPVKMKGAVRRAERLWPPPTTAHLLSARRTAPFILTGYAARSDIQLAMPITQLGKE
jgi:hypothetical protein